MSTVYSLVCWGGRLGKTVTLTIASPCVVTSTNHGLRDGTRLVFSTTGALPAGITAGTTYYAKSTAANTFNLYTDAALTSIVNTSGTQSGTHTAKSVLMTEYFAQHSGRWGDAGSERCYGGLVSWNSGRASASSLDKEVCEIGEEFTEALGTTTLTLTVPAGAIDITTKVNGVYSPAYHFGVVGAGYKLTRQPTPGTPSIITVGALFNVLLDGFTVASSVANNYSVYGFNVGFGSRAQKMISIGQFNGYGFGFAASSGSVVDRCLCIGWSGGIYYATYQMRPFVSNCTLVGNSNGIVLAATTNINAYIYNTVSIGNTVNWPAPTTGTRVGANNAGLSDGAGGYTGGTPWGNYPVACLTSDFVDLVGTGTAPKWTIPPNYALAAGSTLIDAGVEFYGISISDIANAEVPNYNNGGSEGIDIGCYEYDHGYGDHPATATISLTNIVSGSRVLITRDDTSAVLYNDVPGASLSFVTGYIGNFSVVIRKASESPYYREFSAGGATVVDQTTSIKALQQLDE